MPSIYLLHVPAWDETINQIISEVHFTESATKKGKVVKPIKNQEKMYLKYIYVLHVILSKLRYSTKEYYNNGAGISTKQLCSRIGLNHAKGKVVVDNLIANSMIEIVQDAVIVWKGETVDFKNCKARTFQVVGSVGPKDAIWKEFASEKYGKIVLKLIEYKELAKKAQELKKLTDPTKQSHENKANKTEQG